MLSRIFASGVVNISLSFGALVRWLGRMKLACPQNRSVGHLRTLASIVWLRKQGGSKRLKKTVKVRGGGRGTEWRVLEARLNIALTQKVMSIEVVRHSVIANHHPSIRRDIRAC